MPSTPSESTHKKRTDSLLGLTIGSRFGLFANAAPTGKTHPNFASVCADTPLTSGLILQSLPLQPQCGPQTNYENVRPTRWASLLRSIESDSPLPVQSERAYRCSKYSLNRCAPQRSAGAIPFSPTRERRSLCD